MTELIRINKRLSELGLCSRREGDTLITEGVIRVNGKKAKLGQKVTVADKITLDREIGGDRQYLAYYKGRGIITHSPDATETDVAMRLKKDYELTDIYPVGRLDKDSEGLLILTNDGRVTAPLLDPEANIEKTYEVEVDKPVNAYLLKHLANGVNIEGYKTKAAQTEQKSPKRLLLTITEGKKHQIRRMCAALGFQVQSLKRVRVANIEIGTIKPNQYRKITDSELTTLLKTLNIKS